MSGSDKESTQYAELNWHQKLVLAVIAGLLRIWWRTLRFRIGPEVRQVIDNPPPASVVIFWHNRLFAAPEFFRRYFRHRQLASLISASRDGSWPAAFMEQLGMRPIRGSQYKRGAQAFREMIESQKKGYDIAVTPDGSRGPIYDMKPGAIALAGKTGAPFLIFSLNFSRAWRLNSWDRFYVPVPFSRVDAQIEVIENPAGLSEDPKELAKVLKAKMDAITVDL